MDSYEQNKHKLDLCICNEKHPCTCGYMNSEYRKNTQESITLINDLSIRLGRVEDALEMLIDEVRKSNSSLDVSRYENILEEDRV